MSGETILTIVGNLTADPSLTFLQSGAAVCSFTVAATPRIYDKATSEWRDGEALFMRCSAWRQLAENVAESFVRGTRVVVVGKLSQRTFETREGEKRTVIELEAEEVAASAKFTGVKVQRTERASTQQTLAPPAPAADPWGQPAPTGNPATGGRSTPEEPPFMHAIPPLAF